MRDARLIAILLTLVFATGCSRVRESEPWDHAREASRAEVQEFWFDDLPDPRERFVPDREGRVVQVVTPGTGARVVPRSLVKVLLEGLDPVDRRVLHRHELLALVPNLHYIHGYSLHEAHGPPLSDESRKLLAKRGVGTDPSKGPALITHWGSAPLPWDGIYRMRAGGAYELPHPTMASPRGLNDPLARPFDATPIVRLTILETCLADLRRVDYTYLEWDKGYIQHPRRLRTESWHEIHGCKK